MPSRNAIKEYANESYYHVYARGASKQKVFLEAADYHYFLGLFERYLSSRQKISKSGEPYPHFKDRIKLIAYCLMTNHFHLLIYQESLNDMRDFMKSVMTSYSRHFNLKYKRSGSLFESRYKASRIDSNQYLDHISRYIHLNPRRWETYLNSSLRFYTNGSEPEWLTTQPILTMFASRGDYYAFVKDYEAMRNMLTELKYQLAD
jgi:putative transposase